VYVRHKIIKGHRYYYLVRGERRGRRVQQIHVRYLGKNPWAHVKPTGFAGVPHGTRYSKPQSRQEKIFLDLYRKLGVVQVSFNIPFKDSHLNGETGIQWRIADGVPRIGFALRFRRPVSGFTMAHELGHVIDLNLQYPTTRRAPLVGSSSREFASFTDELHAITEYRRTMRRTLVSKARIEKLEHWQRTLPDRPARQSIERELQELKMHYESYVHDPMELFAELIAVSIIAPRKARQLAPRATGWLLQLIADNPPIRDALAEAGFLELGTTDQTVDVDSNEIKC
jgi:hypothetical protein